jgi:ketosteroid isomerase-like protein
MKKTVGLTLALLFCVPGSLGLAQRAPKKTPLETMVETERAFARMSEEQGTRPAFMAFIAEDGILFRPTAVKGKQWMTAHPVPASDKRPWLSWYPAVAGMSRYGDMGYSTGPWQHKADIHDTRPDAWGTFLTIWKRQPDGEWRFAIDLGISNPQPAQAVAPWTLPRSYRFSRFRKGSWTFSANALLARDTEFAKDSVSAGARDAFLKYASGDVRVYRDGKFPFVGRKASVTALPEYPTEWTWTPAFSDVSNSDDLGYSYGTYKIKKGEQVIEAGNYMRIWRKEGGQWKVLFDLTNPLPLEKKN